MESGYKTLFQATPVLYGRGAGLMRKVHIVADDHLFPDAMLRQIACNTAGYPLLGNDKIPHCTCDIRLEIVSDPGPDKQGMHLLPLVGGPVLDIKVKTPFGRKLIILKGGRPSAELRLCGGGPNAGKGQCRDEHNGPKGQLESVFHPPKRRNKILKK